jgi:hypothetical protein
MILFGPDCWGDWFYKLVVKVTVYKTVGIADFAVNCMNSGDSVDKNPTAPVMLPGQPEKILSKMVDPEG